MAGQVLQLNTIQSQMLTNTLIVGEDVFRLFPFPATFSEKFMEVWEWKTDIHSSFNAVEQREMLRANPRMTYEFSAWALREDANLFKNLIWGNLVGGWGLPMWHQPQTLKVGLAVGSTVLTLQNTTDFGGYVVLFIDAKNYQWVKILSKTATTLTLDTALTAPFLVGTPVFPVNLAKLEESQDLKHLTANLLTSYCTFQCLSVLSPYTGIQPNDVRYKEQPILEVDNNWAEGLTDKYERKVSVFDTELFDFSRDIEGGSPTITKTFNWFLNGKENLTYFKAWMLKRKGRLTPFWLPSQVKDFTYISHLNSTLTTKFSGFSFLSLTNSPRDIRVEFTDGTVEYREIASVLLNGDNEILTLTSVLPIGDIKAISFLYFVRLDTDRIEVVYQTGRFASALTPTRSLVYV